MLNMRIFADIFSARMHVYMNKDTGYRDQGTESKDYAAFLICDRLQIVICDRIFVDCSPPIVRPKNCAAEDRAAD